MVTPRTNDDLFELHTMSFGEHLEELRRALVKSSLWLLVGTTIGFCFSEHVAKHLSEPFRRQLREYHIAKTTHAYQQLFGSDMPADFRQLLVQQKVIPRSGFELEVSNLDRSQDLSVAAKSAPNAWLDELAQGRITRVKPKIWLEAIPDSLNSFGIFEGFFIYLQASVVVGVALALPGMFWHIWEFVAAGLYCHERRRVYQYLPLSVVLFIAGASLAYFVMMDLLIAVMLPYNMGLGIEIQPRVKDCFSLALWMPLLFGLCFQLPLVMVILSTLGISTAKDYLANQKIALLAITFLSMVLTPSDPYTFIGLLVPLVALYYLGILLTRTLH